MTKQAVAHTSRLVQVTLPLENKDLFLCVSHRHNWQHEIRHGRVSTDGQHVDPLVRQPTKAGCKKVFRETASGAKTGRARLRKAADTLEADAVPMVTRLGRPARSTRDMLNTFANTADRKAGFRSLGDVCRIAPHFTAACTVVRRHISENIFSKLTFC